MKFERTDYHVEIKSDHGGVWLRRGTAYKTEEGARRWYEHLKETWPKAEFRLVSQSWYSDSRVLEGSKE